MGLVHYMWPRLGYVSYHQWLGQKVHLVREERSKYILEDVLDKSL